MGWLKVRALQWPLVCGGDSCLSHGLCVVAWLQREPQSRLFQVPYETLLTGSLMGYRRWNHFHSFASCVSSGNALQVFLGHVLQGVQCVGVCLLIIFPHKTLSFHQVNNCTVLFFLLVICTSFSLLFLSTDLFSNSQLSFVFFSTVVHLFLFYVVFLSSVCLVNVFLLLLLEVQVYSAKIFLKGTCRDVCSSKCCVLACWRFVFS